MTAWYEADPERLEQRTQALRDLEHGDNAAADMATFIADRIVRCHLATMDRLNVEYDLLSWEGDILRLDFWTTAFDVLKKAGALFLQETGKQAGCWVMEIDDGQPDHDEPDDDDEARLKVVVRSDGTVTYVGKDIAYQFWKFGLLGARLPLSSVCHAALGAPPVGDDGHDRQGRPRQPAATRIRSRRLRLQRDRHPAVVSPAASAAGLVRRGSSS